MFVRITFWLVLLLFFADLAQPGYLKFWQPNLIELSLPDIRLPFIKKNRPTISSTCPSPDNDLEAVLQAKFGCDNATPDDPQTSFE